MANPISEVAALTALLNTPGLSSLNVKVVIQGQVQVEAQGPNPIDRVRLLLLPDSVQDILQYAPQGWWLNSTSLFTAVQNGWIDVLTAFEGGNDTVIPLDTTYIPQPLNPQVGDLLVFDGNGWVLLPVGASGQVLTSNGAGFLPSYQAGGGGGGGATVETFTAVLGVQVGDAVYLSGLSTVDRANAASTPHAIGIVNSMSSPTEADVVLVGRSAAVLVGLTPGTRYYVSTTDGLITSTAPSATGQYVQMVGTADTATTLIVQLGDTYLL